MSHIVHDSPAPSLDEIWRLFKETSLLIQEGERRSQEREQAAKQEAERRAQEWEQAAERRAQETERRAQETERRVREWEQAAERRAQEAERRAQEHEREMQENRRIFQEYVQDEKRRFRELDKLFKETDKKIGELGNRLGDFVEGFVAPGAVRLFRERGIEVTGLSRNVQKNHEKLGLGLEIDLLVTNGDVCVLVEVKSHLGVDDVNEHLERMEKFKPLFPEYADKKVHGAVAAMVLPEEVAKYAYRKGFFVIAQKGESVVLLNDEKFTPMTW